MDYQAQLDNQTICELIVDELRKGPATRRELCFQLGYSRTTIGRALEKLFSQQVIEVIYENASGRGRPAEKLQLATKTVHAIGMDISRRRGIAVAINRLGETLAVVQTFGIEQDDWPQALEELCQKLADQLSTAGCNDAAVSYVGVGVPIPIGCDAWAKRDEPGTLVNKLQKQIHQHWETTILVDNTIRMAALGEARWGAGKDLSSQFYIRISGGIVGCATVRNVISTGAHGYAGEIGHIGVPGSQKKCYCGKTGCLETVASVDAICEHAQLDNLALFPVILADENHPQHQSVSEAIELAVDSLAWVCANSVMLLDPSQIVLAGAVPCLLPDFVEQVETAMQKHLISDLFRDTKVVLTKLDSEGAARGAIAAAQTYLHQNEVNRTMAERQRGDSDDYRGTD
ncbi:hypothetical protein BK816_01425 [Boudabousia tangfeifanii]|uniref:HTH marR-type domain-containing protein n=1 Tax=Boudabousia tangfeifanii TaxID=1912795 RepID=A0A1D9MIU1_9ACTO|nr:ROK family transcriptional regulator [Boudabousia tangfeifanii]AOZ72118.1 hypothetical protein BK816_01425 [Boudabousia tangfeifanii]